MRMALYRNILRWMQGGQSRNKGLQISGPASYSHQAATNVTVETALQLSAVWSCVKLITESIGSLPINFYKKSDGGVLTPFPDHPLAKLFRGKVNRWQTRQEYIESIVYQFVMQGNDYSVIQRQGGKKDGDIISLVPLMTPQMMVDLQDSGDVLYKYTEDKGIRIYNDKTVWHNKLFGNGIVGMNPIAYARNSIGVGQAAEFATTKIYRNGGKPSGLLMIDKTLTADQRAKIKQNFAELAEGNEERLFVLEADMKYEQVSLSPQDIELLQSRRFQIEDICRFFGVPSILVNDNHENTAWGTGIEQIIQGFYKFGLRPITSRYAESMKARLLTPQQRDTMEIRFDFDDLLEASLADRIKSGKEGVTGGLLKPNEWRSGEGLPPVPGGDKLFLQQQMTPVDQLEKIDRTKGTPPAPISDGGKQ